MIIWTLALYALTAVMWVGVVVLLAWIAWHATIWAWTVVCALMEIVCGVLAMGMYVVWAPLYAVGRIAEGAARWTLARWTR